MQLLKKYRLVIFIVLSVLIPVLIRSFWPNQFKVDAKRWAEPSFTLSNIISVDQVTEATGEKLIIYLGEENQGFNFSGMYSLYIPADSIINKTHINLIRKHEGPVMLASTETAVSAKIWMILSQMGYDNLYIITDEPDNEVLKYKFRPDTSARPEL